jgi:hypothetical protein
MVSISSILCCLDANAQKALWVAISEKAACRAILGASSAILAATVAGHKSKNSATPSHLKMRSFEQMGESLYLL